MPNFFPSFISNACMTPKHIIRIDGLLYAVQSVIVGPPKCLLEIGFVPISLFFCFLFFSDCAIKQTDIREKIGIPRSDKLPSQEQVVLKLQLERCQYYVQRWLAQSHRAASSPEKPLEGVKIYRLGTGYLGFTYRHGSTPFSRQD